MPTEIRGRKDEYGHYWVSIAFICPHPEVHEIKSFMVDTGATITTISSEAFGLDLNDIEESITTVSSNGEHEIQIINKVLLRFETTHGNIYPVELERVGAAELQGLPYDGVLGIDVINTFGEVTFSPDGVVFSV